MINGWRSGAVGSCVAISVQQMLVGEHTVSILVLINPRVGVLQISRACCTIVANVCWLVVVKENCSLCCIWALLLHCRTYSPVNGGRCGRIILSRLYYYGKTDLAYFYTTTRFSLEEIVALVGMGGYVLYLVCCEEDVRLKVKCDSYYLVVEQYCKAWCVDIVRAIKCFRTSENRSRFYRLALTEY